LDLDACEKGVPLIAMHNPVLRATLLDHIQKTGYNVGHAHTGNPLTGKLRVTLDVSKPDKSEAWTVHADIDEEYEAIIDLMQRLRFDLEDWRFTRCKPMSPLHQRRRPDGSKLQ
jgi:hypothetical protein